MGASSSISPSRRPAPDTAAPPRYLAKWDSVLLAYAPRHRVRILPQRYREAIIGINGDTAATFLVDGVVAGTWTVERKGRQAMLRLSPFGRLARADRAALVDEGERLVRFVEPRAAVHGVK